MGTDEPKPYRLPGALQFDLRSRAGTDHRVFLHVPSSPSPPSGFPVLYVLDGNALFGTAVEAIALQMRRPKVTGVPPAVVVGIGYPTEDAFDITRRTYDLTPPGSDDAENEGAGGAGAFFETLRDEIRPQVEALVKIDTARQALFGHSFGGLFALWTFFNHPHAFSSYIAASPSIWWSDKRILADERAFVPPSDKATRLLITVGSLESSNPQAGAQKSAMVEDASALADRLSSDKRLDVTFVKFEDETHISVIPAAISRSVRFAWA